MVSNFRFNLHFLMTNEVKRLSFYYLATCVSSLFKCKSILPTFVGLFIFLLLRYKQV